MSYFDTHQLERTKWKCSLNLEAHFNNHRVRGLYQTDNEYVAIWYNNRISTQGTQTLVEVNFVNLTNPTYIKDGKELQSFLVVNLPINYLHKIPFGSIWKNGKSSEKFVLTQYEVIIKQDRSNFSTACLNAGDHSFESKLYVHQSHLNGFNSNRNELLVVKQDNLSYIVHPLHFFMAHYGYSGELKRILMTDNWNAITKKLCLNEPTVMADNERIVMMPRNLSHKDAIFLYHLKYDTYTQKVIREFNANVLFIKENYANLGYNYRSLTAPCWHEQEIRLSFYGIPLCNSVLCCQVTGISQPQGDPITLALTPLKTHKKGSNAQDSDTPQFRTFTQKREHELDKLDIAINPVNNLVTASVIEKLQTLGQSRQINKIQYTQNITHTNNTKFLPYETPTDFSVGEKYGSQGHTGIANCFYDTTEESVHSNSRLETVWQHAVQLRTTHNATVQWYTTEYGFGENDNFRLISLEKVNQVLDKNYPPAALVICVQLNGRKFFVISFPEREGGSGFSSIVYEPQNTETFLSMPTSSESEDDTLIKLLIEVAYLNAIESDYVDAHEGRMATFKHRVGKNNNWVSNGISKLL